MSTPNPIINEFVEHYVQKFDFYDQLASIVAAQLRSELMRRGIRAIVVPGRKIQMACERN